MREFLIVGKIIQKETKVSKSNNPYTIVYIEDQNETFEVIAGSKVEVPTELSIVVCRGSIRSTPRTYQDRTFYSVSLLASKFEIISSNVDETDAIDEKNIVDNSFENIPF